jgi:hypothetical protein
VPRSRSDRQAELNRKSLLAAERVAQQTLERAKRADNIFRSIRLGIIEARTLSAIAGTSRLEAEAATVGRRLTGAADVVAKRAAESIARAQRIAKNFSDHWSSAGGSRNPVAAAAATKSHLEQIAVTESADAWGGARARYLQGNPGLGLLRVWDSRLDRRTCPVCSGLDGVIVGAREPFPHGEAPIHPWCRCNWTLLTPSEAGGVTTYEPRRPTVSVPVQVVKPKPSAVAIADYRARAKITKAFVAEDSSEARALKRYVGTSAPVNQYMRERAAGAAVDDAAEAEVKKIKSAMREIRSRGGAVSGTVMRGESVDAERFAELSTANTLRYPNFVSTTISTKEAASFSRFTKHQVLISVEDANGIALGGLGSQGGSREVLLEPGNFRVLSRRIEGSRLHLTVARKKP